MLNKVPVTIFKDFIGIDSLSHTKVSLVSGPIVGAEGDQEAVAVKDIMGMVLKEHGEPL